MELGTFLIGLKWIFGIVFWCVLAALAVIGSLYGIGRLLDVIRDRYPNFMKD